MFYLKALQGRYSDIPCDGPGLLDLRMGALDPELVFPPLNT